MNLFLFSAFFVIISVEKERCKMSLGITEILLILVIILLLFGSKKIPELAKSLGKAKQEFKNAQKSDEEQK